MSRLDWMPDLTGRTGPMYEQIATALREDILEGRLKAGDQLPPQRDLSVALGVTVGTVSRAFGEVIRADLIEAGSRRGTRVKERTAHAGFMSGNPGVLGEAQAIVDLRGHQTAVASWGQRINKAMLERSTRGDIDPILRYDDFAGRAAHRAVGAQWLSKEAHEVDPARVVVTNGAQHALLCALLSISRRGDNIATERLTYTGLRSVAPLLGLNLIPVDIDRHGILPASFAQVCATQRIAALVCVPNLHNPTTAVLPLDRRKELVRIASANDVMIIEDDVYNGLVDPGVQSLASLAQERVIRLTSFSKTLGPGLRIGYIEAPRSWVATIADAIRATTWMASPIAAELATELILSGEAASILNENRTELALRNTALRRELKDAGLKNELHGPHAWIELPAPWTVKQFTTWIESRGYKVSGADGFAVSRDDVDHAVRISVSAAPSVDSLTRFGRLIAEALPQGPQVNDITAFP
ncbi:MAG: PLP-dependent aminotransferase family protein [Pseudomonadota bacterium]